MEVENDNSYTVNSFAVHNCELAIALAMKLDPILGAIGDRKNSIVSSLGKNKQRNILFTSGNNLFSSKKQKLWI